MGNTKPQFRRTHDLSLILLDETQDDEHPSKVASPSMELPKVPPFSAKDQRPLRIPSTNNLEVDQRKAYRSHNAYDLQSPVPPVYTLIQPPNKGGVDGHSITPSKTLKAGLQDDWNDRTLRRRARSPLRIPPLGHPTSETSQPPSKIRVTETPNFPVLRPIPATNISKTHSNERLCDNPVGRSCHPHLDSDNQGTPAVIQGTPPPTEQSKAKINYICQPPSGPGTLLRYALHQESLPLNSHSNLQLLSRAVSRCSPKSNGPSIECVPRSEEKGEPHLRNEAQRLTVNHSQQKIDHPWETWDRKLGDDRHRCQTGGHSAAPSDQNDPGNPNMMYVNNIVQNVYFPSEKHRQGVDAQRHHPPQPSPGHRSVPESYKTIAPRHNVQDCLSGDGRVYDLAKIQQAGLAVIGGRVYNQQNHPMCAAPRENGIPCKRNVSRSACRWHGSVRVLTPHNTICGLLDNFGNLAHVDASINENRGNSGARSSGTSQQQIIPSGASAPQRFSPPRVVARSLRWNNEEHYWFLLGLQRYGHRWSTISKVVRTRDTLQVQSHAQKYFERQIKVDKKKSTIHDLRINGTELSEVAAKYTADEIHSRVALLDADDIRTGNRSTVASTGN